MGILVTGICGFVGATPARKLREGRLETQILGLDNFVRATNAMSRTGLRKMALKMWHGEIRNPSGLEFLPRCDRFPDAAENSPVMAGVNGKTRSGLTQATWFRQLGAWRDPRWLKAIAGS